MSLTSVRPGLFMEKKMRSARRVLESSCFSVAGSEASLMPFVRPCMRQLVSRNLFSRQEYGARFDNLLTLPVREDHRCQGTEAES